MRGMDQTTARRRAKELGGIARSARNPERYKMWQFGGWGLRDDVWVVTDLSMNVMLDNGEERNYPLRIRDVSDLDE